MTEKVCRRCLLSEMDKASFDEIVSKGLASLKEADRCLEKVYNDRLQICRNCDNLVSGTCLLCGCYVEIRGALKNGKGPKNKW